MIPVAGNIAKVVALTRSATGQTWVARDGRVSLLRQGQLELVGLAGPTRQTYPYIQGIAASRDGGLWVACDGSLKKWRDGQWVASLGAAPWGGAILTRLMETKNGTLAGGGANGGVYLVFPSRTNTTFVQFNRTNGLPSDWVIALGEDCENNSWIGTGAGLVALSPSNAGTVAPPDQWQGRPVLSVCAAPGGALWIGTEGAGLYRLQGGAWTNFSQAQGLRNAYVWSLAEDGQERLWVGTWGGGLFRQRAEAFEMAPGLENLRLPMPALLPAPDGLWIGTTMGLRHYQDGALREMDQFPGDVRAMARDQQGVMWVGTAGSGLARLEGRQVRWFKKADGLGSDFVECLRLEDDGTLWIGTFGGGLVRFKDGHFAVINRKAGLPNSVIGDIEPDDQGFFWMSSNGGIIRVSKAELNRCADGKSGRIHGLTYGINDGLPTLECSEGLQSAGAKTPDGRLWFPTAKGLVVVNPAELKTNTHPPQVVIETMRVDDRPFALASTAGAPRRIPPGRHRLEFEYTGLSFVAPEKVKFKCRLDGLDADWTDAGAKRVATYNYLPPGGYSFRVIACNNDGVWNATGARLAFEVRPHFWQTLWCHVLGGLATVLAASGAVWFETRRRMRRRLEQAERQRDLARERARIARDIHDDLGAQLTRITMMSESARGEPANSGRAAAGLEKIYDTARALTRSLDEIVWAVSPRHDTLESLATYLEKFAQDWLATAGFRCRLDLPLEFPEWALTSEVRHNVFLAFKEALHNTVKHSGATEVRIRLTLMEKSFDLAVEDNGRGFAVGEKGPAVSATPGRAASGNGLENMRRRLAASGGGCDIQSAPGAGTRVVFSVPLRASAPGKPGR